jgi:hypothetical protein
MHLHFAFGIALLISYVLAQECGARGYVEGSIAGDIDGNLGTNDISECGYYCSENQVCVAWYLSSDSCFFVHSNE